jgi:hypothetical protein
MVRRGGSMVRRAGSARQSGAAALGEGVFCHHPSSPRGARMSCWAESPVFPRGAGKGRSPPPSGNRTAGPRRPPAPRSRRACARPSRRWCPGPRPAPARTSSPRRVGRRHRAARGSPCRPAWLAESPDHDRPSRTAAPQGFSHQRWEEPGNPYSRQLQQPVSWSQMAIRFWPGYCSAHFTSHSC